MPVAAILGAIFTGFVIGGAARWIVPGPDPMPFWLTMSIGVLGSAAGGSIAAATFGTKHVVDSPAHFFITVLLEIAAAAALVILYRRFVQKRPLTGPEAYRFPTRGIGVPQIRERLRRLGVDPDKLTGPGGVPPRPEPTAPEDATAELEQLRDLHEKGVLTDEEYERARERLRRY
jgi:uncharacterized membrane protein YeaQ/YmgE (transglycosylase-associated protein family)